MTNLISKSIVLSEGVLGIIFPLRDICPVGFIASFSISPVRLFHLKNYTGHRLYFTWILIISWQRLIFFHKRFFITSSYLQSEHIITESEKKTEKYVKWIHSDWFWNFVCICQSLHQVTSRVLESMKKRTPRFVCHCVIVGLCKDTMNSNDDVIILRQLKFICMFWQQEVNLLEFKMKPWQWHFYAV